MHKTSTKQQLPKRDTARNILKLVSNGQFAEIGKVIRRRALNTIKFLRRCLLRILGVAYDRPIFATKRQKKQLQNLLKKHYSHPDISVNPTKNRLSVALIIRDGTTHPKSSAFIRLLGPLTTKIASKKLELDIFPENSYIVDSRTHVCIVQRTAFDNVKYAKKLVKNIRQNHIKLVVDIDDAFNVIHKAHPEHSKYSRRSEALNYLLQEADETWISTKTLSKSYPKIRNSFVIENSLDNRIWNYDNHKLLKASGRKPLQIVYMGTATHNSDLAMIMPALDKVAKQFPDSFKLTIIGVADDLPQRAWLSRLYQKRGGSIYPKFVSWFLKQGPFDIGLSPLADNSFNNSKSDIKCLDYIAAGIVPVVSNAVPYKNPDLNDFIIRVNDSVDDWFKVLSRLVSTPEITRQENIVRSKKGTAYLWKHRSANDTSLLMLRRLSKLI